MKGITTLLILTTSVLFLPTFSQALKIETLVFDFFTNNEHHPVTLIIKHDGDTTTVTYYNELGDKERSIYNNRIRLLSSVYYDPLGNETAKTIYDHKTKRIRMIGDQCAEYNYIHPTFDNNGSLFYLFSVFRPSNDKTLTFRLTQTNLKNIDDPLLKTMLTQMVGPIEMVLKFVKKETLEIAGTTYETKKYVMAIQTPTIALLWSSKYYFWYDEKTNYMVRYSGTNTNHTSDSITLIDHYTVDIPSPELPSL